MVPAFGIRVLGCLSLSKPRNSDSLFVETPKLFVVEFDLAASLMVGVEGFTWTSPSKVELLRADDGDDGVENEWTRACGVSFRMLCCNQARLSRALFVVFIGGDEILSMSPFLSGMVRSECCFCDGSEGAVKPTSEESDCKVLTTVSWFSSVALFLLEESIPCIASFPR